ncbi:MAG: TonB-dependent receptor [bacterium]
MSKRFTLSILLIMLLFYKNSAQEPVQTFRGRVLDAYTELPLPGATVVIEGTSPLRGTSTDINGNFQLEGLSLGRIHVRVSMMGYQPVQLRNLLLVSGRELVMDIKLEEQVYVLEDVEVRPDVRKDQPLNEMAMVSARSFSIDETERYAGSLGDPSRMAANFAGVSSVSDQRNDIIIRGNSPLGLLWRLEGVEIPNPNHFGSLGSTGGPVSMLNNNLLTHSDFYSGAFPAEFGNALAGAFDLRMRHGNNQQHEFMGQVGFNGFELGAEGPFARNSQASYLANFRYSTMEVLHATGMNFGTGAAIPKYKDLSFKLNFPTKTGRISFFGLGGTNTIAMLDSKEDDAQYGFSGTDLYYDNSAGVTGITYIHYFNENSRLTNTLAVSGIEGSTKIFDLALPMDQPSVTESLWEVKYSLSSKYAFRINSRNYFNAGMVYDFIDASYHGKYFHETHEQYHHYLQTSGNLSFARAYAEWRHRFSDELSVTSGLHSSYLFLNDSYAVEPRIGAKWEFSPGQSLNFGAGLHSQMQMRAVYFGQRLVDTLNLTYEMTNKNLDFTRSLHLIAGYERLLGQGHRLKAEAYYQYLYDVPVAGYRPEFSMLSQGGGYGFMTYDHMQNSGIGENKGIELTLEKFLHKGFYYLVTASVFDAGYRGYDGVWRNSAFNNNFVFNALSGYEWDVGRKSLLSVDLKMVYAGGSRYLPIDVETSQADDAVRYQWNQAFEERFPDYFRLNGRITLRLNGRKVNQEWALDLQNMTNHENIFTQNWNNNTQEVDTSYQMGFMPMMTYRIYF